MALWGRTWKRKAEKRGADYSDAVVRLIQNEAGQEVVSEAATAAVEAAAGTLSRALGSARVEGDPQVVQAVTPEFLRSVGRDLVVKGASLHLIDVDRTVRLTRCSDWSFAGSPDPATWTVEAFAPGPTTSLSRRTTADGVVLVTWSQRRQDPTAGAGPLSLATLTASMAAKVEKALGDEASTPAATVVTMPEGTEEGGEADGPSPLDHLRRSLRAARGSVLLVETTASGYGQGMAGAPRQDWKPSRIGPAPPEALADLHGRAFAATLSACGVPPSVWESGADGTSQREGLRRLHLGTVLPLARQVEDEVRLKLEGDCRLVFDSYPLDIAGRSQSLKRLVESGVPVEDALRIVGL